uniref:Uncharacterized protein n=1 Tax=Octopus bimaculoides TaxID=37653 RepID=A0A0L8FWL3_OCTBM
MGGGDLKKKKRNCACVMDNRCKAVHTFTKHLGQKLHGLIKVPFKSQKLITKPLALYFHFLKISQHKKKINKINLLTFIRIPRKPENG